MSRSLTRILLAAAALAGLPPVLAHAAPPGPVVQAPTPDPLGSHGVQVCYRNLTTGQIFSPTAIASHNRLAPPFFELGKPASFSLQRMAEEGNSGPTFSGVIIPNLGSLFRTAATTLSALPGQSRCVTVRVTPEFPLISAYWMLVRTNDGFTGFSAINGYALTAPSTFETFAYDAGTEKNNEQAPYLVALDGSGRDPEGGVMERHPGLRTNARDLKSDIPGDWYFDPAKPVAKIQLTPVP